MASKKNSIKSQWHAEDSSRQEVLDRARQCAALTKPWILPPQGQFESEKLPEPFSSLAARGITNLEGRLLLALYPPGMPFFRLRPSTKYRLNPQTDPELLNQFEQALFMQELTAMSKLEMAHAIAGNYRRGGFRSAKRTSISQLLITGDTLEMLTDDYRIKVIRRDHYTTRRDSEGMVRSHIVREQIDPLSLTDPQLEILDIDSSVLAQKQMHQRKEDMYTMVEWQPRTKVWLIRQEVKDTVIHEHEDPVSPFFCTPFELAPGEHYGRGLIEMNLGDVRSMNALTERILDFAALASKQLFATDYNSQVRPKDLAKPSGSVIQARVQSGQVTDIATIKSDKVGDFTVAHQTREAIRKDLAVTMLMEAEATPTGERVTAYQVQRVALELEGALGGVYAPISDAQQVPLVERLLWQLRRDAILPPIPDGSVEIETVTGISALSMEVDQGKLMSVLSTVAQLGPETLARVDKSVLLDLLMRQAGIFKAGLIKSEERMQQEAQAQQQQMMQAQAQQQLIQSAGAMAEKSTPEAGAMNGQ